MDDFNPNCVLIPLSKTGKHAGKYTAIVSPEDADLAEASWAYLNPGYAHKKTTPYNPNKGLMHRVVLSRVLNRKLLREEQVDHINGCGIDNRRENLRLATPTQNAENRQIRSDNTSGYKGVSWKEANQKWTAKICKDGKQIHLGLFNTPEEAYAAYCEAADKYHQEYANKG